MPRQTKADLTTALEHARLELTGKCQCDSRTGAECLFHGEQRELAAAGQVLARAVRDRPGLTRLALASYDITARALDRELGRALINTNR